MKKKVKKSGPTFKFGPRGNHSLYNIGTVDDSVEDDELNDFMFSLPEGFGIDFGIWDDDDDTKVNQGCSHKWKTYYGFNDAFEYCETCDKKRELKNG